MTTPAPTPLPEFGSPNPRPKRVLWKWSLLATALLVAFFAFQCGSALYHGRDLANVAVRTFHQRLNDQKYEEICDEAAESFSRKQEETIRFLQVVHTKLGTAGTENLTNIRVNATANGTFLITQYTTVFERDKALETFTWIKTDGTLKLCGYNINSNALILN